jgi:PAS domain S-box-containing protein
MLPIRHIGITHMVSEPIPLSEKWTHHKHERSDVGDALLDATPAAIVGVDRLGRTIVWNRGAESLFGWSREDVIGRTPPIVPKALRQEWRLQMRQVLEGGRSTVAAETQRLARDGRLVPVMRSSAPLVDADGAPIGVLDTLIDMTEHKHLDDESRALAQIRERELIAMDLHDGLVQQLYSVVLGLAAHERDHGHAATPAATLGHVRAELESIIDETRRYLYDLRARELMPRNLTAGLRLLVDSLRLNASLTTDLRLDPSADARLEPDVRGQLLYVAREAVSNILRHAEASAVCVELALLDDRVQMTVADNGRGFDASTRGGSRHYGLRNMNTRARLIGGRLSVSSAAGKGTQIRLEIPLPPDPPEDD